jgi:bisphosphoglycerate-dependent phosphoglycerate mutase
MTLYETIRTAILENFDREIVVYLADGREIVVAADLETVRELVAEITAAVEALS